MPLGSVALMGLALRRSAEQGHPGGAIHHAGWLEADRLLETRHRFGRATAVYAIGADFDF